MDRRPMSKERSQKIITERGSDAAFQGKQHLEHARSRCEDAIPKDRIDEVDVHSGQQRHQLAALEDRI